MTFSSPTNIDSFSSGNEIFDIISSLNILKAVQSSSNATKILRLLNKDMFNQMTSLFNLSLSSGIFSDILKTSKIAPIRKKDLKLKLSNY